MLALHPAQSNGICEQVYKSEKCCDMDIPGVVQCVVHVSMCLTCGKLHIAVFVHGSEVTRGNTLCSGTEGG
jgi:hypothetical protein